MIYQTKTRTNNSHAHIVTYIESQKYQHIADKTDENIHTNTQKPKLKITTNIKAQLNTTHSKLNTRALFER
jgi:BMFP domain-containing protein YqiC